MRPTPILYCLLLLLLLLLFKLTLGFADIYLYTNKLHNIIYIYKYMHYDDMI